MRGVVGAEDTSLIYSPVCLPVLLISAPFPSLRVCLRSREQGAQPKLPEFSPRGCARTQRPAEQGEEPGRGTGQSMVPGHPQRQPSQGDEEGRDQEGKNK